MSIQAVRAKLAEAIEAQEAGDFDAAVKKVRSAKMLLATIPTRTRQGESEIAYEREQLDSLLADLQKQQTATRASEGIQRTKFVYKRPGSS